MTWKQNEWIEMNRCLISFQILHVIDDVLIPLSTIQSSNEIFNPDALNFLTNANSFEIGSHRVRSFYQRVVLNKKEPLFAADGYHTFFIPVEEGFKVNFFHYPQTFSAFSSNGSLMMAIIYPK